MNFKHVWYIAIKNLRIFLTDRIAVIMFILFPFFFITMLNLIGNTSNVQDERLTLYLATQESEGLSVQIIQALETGDPTALPPGSPVITWLKDYGQAKTDVEAGKIRGFLGFPSDFTQRIESAETAVLEIAARSDSTGMQMALKSLAENLTANFNTNRAELLTVAGILSQQGRSTQEIQQALKPIIERQSANSGSQAIIGYQVQRVGDIQPFNISSFAVPGYLVMFVFFAGAIASIEIIQERRNHTLERLLASTVSKKSILGGIYLGGLLRGLVQIVVFWTVGILIFRVDLGIAPWAVFLLSLLMVMMSAAFSLMLATIARTERSASALAVLCSLLLAPLGGCWWPLFTVPAWMQFLAKITPHGWANEGFNNLMIFGARGGDVVWSMVVLAGFTVVFALVALTRFQTEAEVS